MLCLWVNRFGFRSLALASTEFSFFHKKFVCEVKMVGYCVWAVAFLSITAQGIKAQIPNGIQSPRCRTPTTAPQKIEKVIGLCQEEIKLAILKEALEILGETTKEVVHATTGHRSKRDLFTEEEQRIAGCLLQCVYRKVKAVDKDGFPTVEGLVKLYAEGVTERGYFIATAQAVQQCLYIGNQQRLASPKPEDVGGQMCDLAYKVFDCVSDQLANYCSRS